jgi:hypothetical protein
MSGRGSVWRKLVAATVVTAGVGVVWCLAVGWMTMLAGLLTGRTAVREDLEIAMDGTPVISVQSDDTSGTSILNRRTLEGKPWPNDYELWQYGVSLRRFELPPGVVRFPIRWSAYGARVGGVTDGKTPPTDWYVVSADPQAAHFYLTGYDPFSKRAVGYLGTAGFRLSPPPLKEQFTFTANEPGPVTARFAIRQHVEINYILQYHGVTSYGRPAPWLMFLVDGKRLWEVDLRERTSRVIMKAADSLSLGLVNVLETTVAGKRRAEGARSVATAPNPPAVAENPTTSGESSGTAAGLTEEPPKTVGVVAIRTPDRILLYDAMSGKHWQFQLPKEVPPGRGFRAYWLAPDSLLLNCDAGWWSGGEVRELYWIAPDGTIQRQERVELQGYVPPPESHKFWALAAMMPEPLAWLGELFGVEPFSRLQDYKADSYGAALAQTLEVIWPMALLVLVVAAVAAWYARRFHRRYFRPHSGTWTAFVFLLGPPGLIAYWLELRRAKLEECGHCGTTVPRDRDACAACESPFPAPPLVGTEVFA